MAGVRARRTDRGGAVEPDPEQDAADARVSGVANRPTLTLLVPAETFAEVQAAAIRADEVRRGPGGEERGPGGEENGTNDGGGGGVAGGAAADGSGDARSAGTSSQAAHGFTHTAVPPATLDDGTPLAMSQLARMLCDSEIGRVVMSAEGLPLDLGRAQRLYSGAQRRAVIVRDRQCAWNGCDVPAAYCEVHHIRWWDRDRGPTSVENGLLVCSHHHHVIHELGLAVRRLVRPTRAPEGRRSDAGGGRLDRACLERGAPRFPQPDEDRSVIFVTRLSQARTTEDRP